MRVDTGRLCVVPPEVDAPGEDDLDELVDGSDGGVPSPGQYIQKHRQRRGMSLEQLAVATKIPRASLELVEQDRFEELPGPVFVKGFLRCAARSLGLAPDAVMELLYERERAALVARRQQRTPDRAAPTPRRGERGGPGARPTTGALPACAPTAPKLPPRVKNPPAPDGGARKSLVAAAWPHPQMLLWIFVALFVAFLLMAAFNLVGSTAGPPAI